MNNQVKPKLMGIDELLLNSLKFFKENIRTLIRIVLVPFAILIASVLLIWSYIVYFSHLASSSQGSATTPFNMMDGNIVALVIGGAFVYVILNLALVFFAVASQRSFFELFAGRYTSYKDMVKLTAKTLHSLIWIKILTRFIIQGGTLLLGIPGIIAFVLTKYSWFEHFSNTKDNRGFRAVIGSWNVTRPYFFPVLWRLISVYLMFGIVVVILFLTTALSIYATVHVASGIGALPLVLLSVVLSVVCLVFSMLSVPVVMRYEWLIYRDLTKYSIESKAANLAEGGAGQIAIDRKYKNRKAIAVVLLILGFCYSVLSAVVGLLSGGTGEKITINGRCDVDPIPAACNISNLPTKLKIQRIAEGTNKQLVKKVSPEFAGYSIDILEGWIADIQSSEDKDFIIVDLMREDDDPQSENLPFMTIVAANENANIYGDDPVEFIDSDGKPNAVTQKAFIGGVVKGARTAGYINRNSIYRLDDKIVSAPLVTYVKRENGVQDRMVEIYWYYFTKNNAYLISMTSPFDKWDQYKAEMYKMALTFRESTKSEN